MVVNPVHPHGRGDNNRYGRRTRHIDGSPPRAWGQFGSALRRAARGRFTPTGVGTISQTQDPQNHTSVHPHGRGDNHRQHPIVALRGGSPPRAWGQSHPGKSGKVTNRFTPTGVGTMLSVAVPQRRRAVHPHGRGDNRFSVRSPRSRFGSPPRAWGQSSPGRLRTRARRFTPTGVGTIIVPPRLPLCATVHPHGRGDNGVDGFVGNDPGGSPPRAWGQSVVQIALERGDRFTPTGVGTISAIRRRARRASVHPHGRGDNAVARDAEQREPGSPPRAWGQSSFLSLLRRNRRFTPTGVGTMCRITHAGTGSSVHPHGRGDNASSPGAASSCNGSPPRAWGQCHNSWGLSHHIRFTPTGVGTMPLRAMPSKANPVHPHGRGDNDARGVGDPAPVGSPPRAWGQ